VKSVNITRRTYNIVESIKFGKPFGIEELYDKPNEANNVSVVLNTLQKKGVVTKLGRGVYYKPIESKYGLGRLPVSERDVIEFVSRKYEGYLSGAYAYNMYGFTTQTATTICIATQKPQREIRLGNYRFKFKKSYVNYIPKEKEVRSLALLDVLTNPERNPGTTVRETLSIAREQMAEKTPEEINKTIELSRSYPKRTRVRLFNILPTEKDYQDRLKETFSRNYIYETSRK